MKLPAGTGVGPGKFDRLILIMWAIRAETSWAWIRLGYAIRPYDMLADRRRWFWRKPTRCGFTEWIR